ncbi:AMP-binding protein [Streptomyces stelliscabiei]|uniref:AMP-binding protein n=1 Tax=Streptomyces stelliscabiei TaxID=146820 RepID=UPI0029A976ED|nr:AMP-binding protein [Streptomyces stelliscabiei]MDX2550310.1 AMP-binding protein [Streptomyces stelliscabiei]MDX2610008.1 AMP-binding protein [Streptomyces stelliscabiei]MDX2635070.1 AMP-binding protein [Streptomyces stelliscabiei]MDX2660016.1 AMP-binding protein [Streptomyces stelliscabiei]MDX2711290.1 AMP-binding protein [Streptomyces stelliscabiei]
MSQLPLDRRVRSTPDRPALVDDWEVLSWSALADQVARVSARLLEIAPGPHDRVVVLGDNAAPTLVSHLAGLRAGVGTVAASRHLTSGELVDQIIDAGATGIVAGPAGAGAALDAARELGLPLVLHGTPAIGHSFDWDLWLAAAPAGLAVPEDRPARPPLVYTSGTTGRARGTEVRWVSGPVADSSAYLAAISARSGFPPGPHLVCGPLQHNAPLTALRHLAAGQPVVVLGRFDPEVCLSRIARWRVTSTVMVPTHFQRLLAVPRETRARYDVSSLTQVSHTGSACPPDVKRAMIEWFGPVLTESYGASEAGTVARIDSTEWLAHPGSVGRAHPPFEVLVTDDDGRPLPPGERGLLAFRAPEDHGVRYHADPDKTKSAYLAPGVFTLGDIGYVDADGYIFITDRAADVVVSGGVNLYPAESEAVLRRHPAVAEVAVIGVPDPDFGESLRALVVATGDGTPAEELDRFCRDRLAAYKCPKSYEFVPELTRNAMGKLDKRAMRRPYWHSERTIAG